MPDRIALIYGTTEGQTKKIAGHIADRFSQKGVRVETYDGKQLPKDFEPSEYEGVIVGASVHAGRYPKYIQKVVREHRDELQSMPSAFFSVSLSESDESEEAREKVRTLIHQFLEGLQWQPVLVASFAGAIPFSQYGFIRRLIMKQIVRRRLGDVDTSRDYEYTDWASVDEFVDQFEARVGAWHTSEGETRPPAP